MSENLEKQCLNCKTFVKKHNFSRHLQRCVKDSVVCPICSEHQDDLFSHIKKCGVKKYTCRCCTAEFSTGRSRCEHEKRCRRGENSKFTPDKTSCNGGFQIYVLKPEIDSIDYEAVLESMKGKIIELLNYQDFKCMKISLSVNLLMRKIMEDVPKTTVFRTSSTMVCKDRGFDKVIDEQISSIDSDIDNYSQNGSGWIIDKVLEIHVHIAKCSVMEWTIYG